MTNTNGNNYKETSGSATTSPAAVLALRKDRKALVIFNSI